MASAICPFTYKSAPEYKGLEYESGKVIPSQELKLEIYTLSIASQELKA